MSVSLREFATTQAVELTTAQRDWLLTNAKSVRVRVEPTLYREDAYDLTPESKVGVINLGDLAIEIHPKLPIDRVLFLISYALDRAHWREILFEFEERDTLLEAIVPGFVFHVERAIRRGLLQGYRPEEDALATIRGRLRFEDQLRDRFGVFPPAEVRYDEYTEDIEENRLLKAAIGRLRRLRLRSNQWRPRLRTLEAAFASAQLVEYSPRGLPRITFTRLNEHYRPAIYLARLILRATSFDLHGGTAPASAFLVDMNVVFEDFVVTALRESLKVSEATFRQGVANHLYLDEARRIDLKPDISWWDGSRCVFVGDVKYKRVNVEGLKHPDVYQLLAYAIAANLPGGLLIYAAGEGEPASHRVVHVGRQLDVVALNLNCEPDEILSRIDGIARRIDSLRDEALGRPLDVEHPASPSYA